MEKITLSVPGSSSMQCVASVPTGKPHGAIIVLQEAFGVNTHIQSLTRRFSEIGYVAIAPELFHRTAEPGFTIGYDQFELLKDHFLAINEAGTQADVQACYDWIHAQYPTLAVAAIGYCMGGRSAFIANTSVPLSCAISYYGGRIAPAHLSLASAQKSPLLFFWGGMDQHISTEQIQSINQALKAEKKKFSCVEISYADHGFSCDERPSYNAEATRQAWAMTVQFLRDSL